MGDERAAIAIAALESQRFGLVVARQPVMSADHLADADAFCRREGVALLITRCSTAESATLAALQADGFRVMDTLARWRRSVEKPLAVSANLAGVALRPLDSSASAAVEQIAEAAFQNYNGHFHADPRLSAAAATATYVSWAARSLTDASAADLVLGAEWQGEVAGFVTLKDGAAGGAAGLWDVPLAAIAPQAQRHGLLTALLAAALVEAQQRGAAYLEYSCVVSNIGAQKALARLGFELSESSYTLHKWFDAES